MRARNYSLIAPGLLGFLGLLAQTGYAQAHRLDAQAFWLPDHKLQVEAWFSSGEPARGAKVEVHTADHKVIAGGDVNDQGVFVCALKTKETLRIVVSAGAEHRKELVVQALDTSSEARPVPLADRNSRLPIKDILIGLGFLLAVAAFLLNYRTSRRLRDVERRLADKDGLFDPRPVSREQRGGGNLRMTNDG